MNIEAVLEAVPDAFAITKPGLIHQSPGTEATHRGLEEQAQHDDSLMPSMDLAEFCEVLYIAHHSFVFAVRSRSHEDTLRSVLAQKQHAARWA